MNQDKLDLNLLIALDRLLETANVTAAAHALGVSQPAMSRTLDRLREVLCDPLLVRAGRGLILTEHAKSLIVPVADALAAARRVFSVPAAFDPSTSRGSFVLAMGDEAQSAFVDAILAELWAEAPHIDVRVRPLSATTVADGRRGSIDLAITPDLAALPASAGAVDLSEFVQRPLYTRHFAVISSPAHPRPDLSLEDYLLADHLLVGFDGSGRGFVDDILATLGLRRRVAATVTSFQTAVTVVSRTALIATIPAEVAAIAGVPLVVSAPPIALPLLPMLMLWHPRSTSDPWHQFASERVARAIVARALAARFGR